MHELSIMQNALQQALQQARLAGARRVHEIRLRVGVLSGVVPEALQMAFETLTTGTVAEKASLAIENVPARFWCRNCYAEFTAETLFGECPTCHAISPELRAGRELELASLEIT
ncbi:MAG TPA: hydrogenase maturation nickel metallochaperone HypA [Verrucomicrobiae bacterium]|nr:hydrogenase maturation nickel metallochaperone HypA [Verrucomicrobiae bacterium]